MKMTANKSIFDHTKVIYADEYANTYNPIWVYRMKFIMRALYYKRAFKHLANNIES
ncbi:virK protein, partial [Vibrio parahaemolyticus]